MKMDDQTKSLPLNGRQAKKASKQASKRKKLEALIRISELNEQDRKLKHELQRPSSNAEHPTHVSHDDAPKEVVERQDSSASSSDSSEECHASNEEPSPKRRKPDPTVVDQEENPVNGDGNPLPSSLDPRNILIQEQQTILPFQSGTAPQSGTMSQHADAGAQAPLPYWHYMLQHNSAPQHPKPVFPHFINGFAPLPLVAPYNVPALLLPAILGNLSSQCAAPYSSPRPLTFVPMPCGFHYVSPYPCHGPCHNPDVPTTIFPNQSAPTAEPKDDVNEELKKLRESLKIRKREAQATPQFQLSAVGDTASLSTREGDRIPIFTDDLQRVILRATLGGGSSQIQVRCGRFKHVSHVSGVKLLLLEGLCLKDIERSPDLSELLLSLFPIQMECIMPTAYEGALLEELAAVPLTPKDRTRLIDKYGSLEYALRRSNQIFRVLRAFFPIRRKDSSRLKRESAGANSTVGGESSGGSHGEHTETTSSPQPDQFPRTLLLMSAWQMIEESYPLPIKANIFKQFEGFGFTKEEYEEVTPSSPMYGLDCEMCLTTLKKHELTRVSVVNEKHELIYDTLVKPPNKIINYLTEFSGITKEMMEGVTTTLKEVQEKLREILEPDAILVGQSLNSDLGALQLMHPYVIDTSTIFNLSGDRSRKSKLKYLAKAFLDIDIQHDAVAGHDPVEDAGTALKLVQLKLSKHLEFGDAVLSQLRNIPFSIPERQAQEIEAEKEKAAKRKQARTNKEDESKDDNVAVSVFRYLNRQTVNIIGSPDVVEEYHKYTYVIGNWDRQKTKAPKLHRPNISRGQDERDIVDKAVQCMSQSFCTIAHARLEPQIAELLTIRDEETTERFKTIINDFHSAAPINSVVILVLGGNSEGATGAVYLSIRKKALTQTRKIPPTVTCH